MAILTMHTLENVSCPGGTSTVVRIPAPRKGFLRRLNIIQSSGDAVNYTVDLFETEVAASGGAQAELYRIGQQLAPSSAGGPVLLQDVEWAYGIPQIDADSPLGVHAIFARVTPGGSGDKTFSFRIGAVSTEIDDLLVRAR